MDEQGVGSSLVGSEEVIAWFGAWPSFHDSEVVSLELHRKGWSQLRVYAFRMTNELDERGYYKLDRHAVITFAFEGITSLSFSEFSSQNVLFDLRLAKRDQTYVMTLDSCYGIGGEISTKNLTVSIESGLPQSPDNLPGFSA